MLFYSIHCWVKSTIRVSLAVCRSISAFFFMHFKPIVRDNLFTTAWIECALNLNFCQEVPCNTVSFPGFKFLCLAPMRTYIVLLFPFLWAWPTDRFLTVCAFFGLVNNLITYQAFKNREHGWHVYHSFFSYSARIVWIVIDHRKASVDKVELLKERIR